MVVTTDIAKLFDEGDQAHALHVVKHDYKTSKEQKYLGQPNEDYPRKNWSSVILWNCWHFGHRKLTPEFVQEATGEYLHRFQWLRDADIGELPTVWNWLADEYGRNNQAKLIHWTLGTPCFPEYSTAKMSEIWHRERSLTEHVEEGR